jgi:hypothetical protein
LDRWIVGSFEVVGVSPFHEQIDPFVLDLSKAETLGQPQRGIEALYVNAKRLARGARFGLQLPQQRRTDAAVAELGKEGDVDDANLVSPACDVEPPGRLPADEDDVERRAVVVLPVVRVLGVERPSRRTPLSAQRQSTRASSALRVLAPTDNTKDRSGWIERSVIAAPDRRPSLPGCRGRGSWIVLPSTTMAAPFARETRHAVAAIAVPAVWASTRDPCRIDS